MLLYETFISFNVLLFVNSWCVKYALQWLQGDDIPEEMLPEPFNRMSLLKETTAVEEEQPAVASLLPQSFQRRFSQKSTKIEAENDTQNSVFSASKPCPKKSL